MEYMPFSFFKKGLRDWIEVIIFVLTKHKQGSLAEWLGTGLQNRLQQFESARNLKQ